MFLVEQKSPGFIGHCIARPIADKLCSLEIYADA
jgi:hypothetical protein